jgi:hypothetical protein
VVPLWLLGKNEKWPLIGFRGNLLKVWRCLYWVLPLTKEEPTMGLNERRKIKELQDTTFPGRVKEIEEICGKGIAYEVDWDSLADDAEGLNFIDNLSCHRLNMALRVICQDDMGKEAVRSGLKLIKLKNVKDKSGMKMSFDGGVLEMHCAYAMKTDGMFGDNAIRELLVAKL